jgi:hypothetical protein
MNRRIDTDRVRRDDLLARSHSGVRPKPAFFQVARVGATVAPREAMRAIQLVVAVFFGACLMMVVMLATAGSKCDVVVGLPTIARPVKIVDSGCWSCGSGSGPSADSITSLVGIADDEVVFALDGQETTPTRRAALPQLIAAGFGYQRSHGQFMDFEITGARGQRRVLVLLH